jgi:mono/diheme cytochrome c family protein
VIDVASEKRVAEHEVARGLSDLAAFPDGAHFAAVDPEAGVLLLLEYRSERLTMTSRLAVGLDPSRVAILPDGKACAVTSRWGRRVMIVDIKMGECAAGLALRRTIDLPFPAREILSLGEGKPLLVAGSFGGKLAIIDPTNGTISSVRELPGHNFRGLTLAHDGSTVVLARQLSSRLATSSFDDVHWGYLMKNQVVTLRTDALIDPKLHPLHGATVRDLDEVGQGAGDPEDVAVDAKGLIVVALAGVGEIATLSDRDPSVARLPVGTRPSSVILGSNGQLAYLADAEDDAVVIVPLGGGTRRVVSLGPRPERTDVERGEQLFNSARLSHHGWLSCRSCHAEGHTGGFMADTFGDKSYGAPKLVPSLLGVGLTGPWGWLGNFPTLEDQILASVETTLRGKPLSAVEVADLASYLRSLRPPPASSVAREALDRGAALFRSKKCANCHAAEALTVDGVKDVGLVDEAGRREFNPPSLRGVGQRSRFLHDGRAGSLESVFSEHRHPPGVNITDVELPDLLVYLRSL